MASNEVLVRALIKFEKSHRLLIEACYAVTHLLHRAGSRYNELNACGGISRRVPPLMDVCHSRVQEMNCNSNA